jgi:predicted transcriptional regulator
MPELKQKSRLNRRSKAREFVLTPAEGKFLKKVGLLVQNELHKAGITLELFAEQVGISRSALQEIVAGRSNLRILTLTSIAAELGYRDLRDFLSIL